MAYNFKGIVTENDWVKYCNMMNRKRNIISACLVYIFFFVYLFFSINIDGIRMEFELQLAEQENMYLVVYNMLSFLRYLIFALIVLTLMIIIMDMVINPMSFRKVYRSSKISSEERSFSVTEEEILVNRENGHTRATKEIIKKIKYYKNVVYVFISSVDGIIIKKDYFTSENDFNEFILFLNKHFDPKTVNGV